MSQQRRGWWSRWWGSSGSNVERIDEARRFVSTPEFAELLTEEREVEAVRAVRTKVPGLTLLDAVTIVREARDE